MTRDAMRMAAAVATIGGILAVTSCATPPANQPSTLAPTTATSQPSTRAGAAGNVPPVRKTKTGATDNDWIKQHQSLVARARQDRVDVYFVGDALTQRWATTGKTAWEKTFGAWNAANFGVGGDTTQEILWRPENGELDGVAPKVFVLMAGANNQGSSTAEQTARGIAAIIDVMQQKDPHAKILLLGILPRGAPGAPARQFCDHVNRRLATLDDGQRVKYLDAGKKFLAANGKLQTDLLGPEQIYLTEKGYQVWAAAIRPTLARWLGQ